MKFSLILVAFIYLCNHGYCKKVHHKYSKEANVDSDASKDIEYLKEMKAPLRMAKLNLVWDKAVKRLSAPKLKKILGELRIQDKEELTLKKVQVEGGDKGGIKEAELRKKLLGIMKNYGLTDHFIHQEEEVQRGVSDHSVMKALFSDKKLNKLWDKAIKSGFTDEELKALKEEFQHHQDKVDQYYNLLDDQYKKVNMDMNSLDNEVTQFGFDELEASDKHDADPTNTIREKHRDLKKGYDRLHKISSTGPNSQEFLEPKVAGLWRLATNADFNEEELQSLHTELKHYEGRLLKLRQITGQMSLKERYANVQDRLETNTLQDQNFLEEKLIKQKKKINKLHEDLELRILARHSEL